MTTPTPPPPRRHVLLVGIDAYAAVDPLHGSVNDIDAIEAILLDRLRVPPEAITKLAAPHPSHERRPRLPERLPDHKNLRDALEALAGDAVQLGDRVLIYYAGHGTQVFPRGAWVAREALVPVDAHDGGELLYDHELNLLLQRIARRTGDLTVVLDCCCSAGASRLSVRPRDSGVRFCRIDDPAPPLPARRGHDSAEPPSGILASLGSPEASDPGYLVAAACQSDESAHEGRSARGKRHGAFTAALLQVLEAQPDSRLETLRWADLWQAVRECVAGQYPGQHPWLIGRAERRLFGGAFRPQDPGYAITRAGDRYRIAAGSLVGLTRGAKVAVYGPTPDFFPPLGSREDLAARLGVLCVEEASIGACTAAPLGGELALVEGARGRWIAPGERDALVVQLDPYDADLARWLEGEARFRIVAAGSGEAAEVFVGRDAGGERWIGDEIHGPGVAGEDGEPPLCRVPADDRPALLRALTHCEKQRLALRLALRCRDLSGALAVRLLDAREAAAIPAAELHDPPLPEVSPDPERRYRYLLGHGQPICIAVENRSAEPLYVSLLNCTGSGRVEILGTTQVQIPPRRRQALWLGGNLGNAFRCGVPAGRRSTVDRLIAVGATVPDLDLSFLRVKESFEEVLGATMREMLPDEAEPRERWTATQVTVKIARS